MKKGGFFISNWTYLIWFTFYFFITWIIFGANWRSFITTTTLYAISISLALSPVGEEILRMIIGAKPPMTQQEIDFIYPMFGEVYQSSKMMYPSLNNEIHIFITNDMGINACAIGRKTIAVTRGMLIMMNEDQIKGVLAHEFGHIANGDTKALLLQTIGNAFFEIMVWCFKFVAKVVKAMFSSGDMLPLKMLASVIAYSCEIFIFVFETIGASLMSLNSRKNEYLADDFAYRAGFGQNLISALYVFRQMDMGGKIPLKDRLMSSHPYLSDRIARLESQNM